jgi:hypothetical protein
MSQVWFLLLCLTFPPSLGVGLNTDVLASNGGVAFILGPNGLTSSSSFARRRHTDGWCDAESWAFPLFAKTHREANNGQALRRQAIVAKASIVPDDGRRRREDRRRPWRGQPGADGSLPSGEAPRATSRIPRAFRSSGAMELEEAVEITKKRGSLILSEEQWEDEGVEVHAKASFRRKDDERESSGENFWLEYQMRVLCDTPYAAPFQPPMQVI